MTTNQIEIVTEGIHPDLFSYRNVAPLFTILDRHGVGDNFRSISPDGDYNWVLQNKIDGTVFELNGEFDLVWEFNTDTLPLDAALELLGYIHTLGWGPEDLATSVIRIAKNGTDIEAHTWDDYKNELREA